jgi:hypothetical protein
MRSTLQKTSSTLGIYAGLLGIQHGVFEILQGNIASGGLLIHAIGIPCQSESVWHACYPALTLVPNLFYSGILAIVAGLTVLIWAAAFVQHKHAVMILMLLSLFLFIVGGGFVSTFIGLIAGVAGSRKSASSTLRQTRSAMALAQLWPWLLIVMAVWLPGSWILGYFFSQAMLTLGFFLFLTFDIGLPILAVFSGFAAE